MTPEDGELLSTGDAHIGCISWGNGTPPRGRINSSERLNKLRELMVSPIRLGTEPIDAYIVMSGDEHQSVEIDEYERRVGYISGFTGSYGDAIITLNKSALWIDSRYHPLANQQLDCDWLIMREGLKDTPTRFDWLKSQVPRGGRVGVNPKLISQYMWEKFEHELSLNGIHLIALNVSLIDEIWPSNERGEKRNKDAFVLDIKYTGKTYVKKLEEVRQAVNKSGADAMVVTALDEIAWLLNIRGRDTPFSPFVRSYIFFDMRNIYLYVNSTQLIQKEVLTHLHSESRLYHSDTVKIKDYADIWSDLRTKSQLYNKILVPSHCVYSAGASHAIYEHIEANKILAKESPIIYLKAVKNEVEIEGMQQAHIRDAAAMCEFFAYIEQLSKTGHVFNELELVTNLEKFHYEQNGSLGDSFSTSVAFAMNGGFGSYLPTDLTNQTILDNSTIVIETGGQYHEGTTAMSRTIHFGEPDDLMRQAYTRALIGHIQFASLTFPNNTKMDSVDVLARGPIWEIGLDYLHETGHGIGAFLSSRESPIFIRYDSEISSKQTFQPGYFLTNELGIYRENYFGVRLTNVLQVVKKGWSRSGTGHSYLGFKVVSLVPYQMKLIDTSLLSADQRKWFNNYNQEVCEKVGKELMRKNKMPAFYWLLDNIKYLPVNGSSRISLSLCFIYLCLVYINLVN